MKFLQQRSGIWDSLVGGFIFFGLAFVFHEKYLADWRKADTFIAYGLLSITGLAWVYGVCILLCAAFRRSPKTDPFFDPNPDKPFTI